MSTTATLVYKAFLGGLSAAAAQTLMAAVPVPPDVLQFLGLRIISDSTTVANPAVRTIVLGLDPVGNAAATAALEDLGASASPVGSLTVTAAGSGYVSPPVVTFTGGRPAPVVVPGFPIQTVDVNSLAGAENSPAVARAYLKVVSAAVASAGSGYSANTFVSVIGALKPGGTPASFSLTIAGGHITGVAIVNPGVGYVGIPSVSVVDPAATPGTGGAITISMGVGDLVLSRSGAGYTAAPTVVLTPYFQATFPPSGDQAFPLESLMSVPLSEALKSPVTAMPVVIA